MLTQGLNLQQQLDRRNQHFRTTGEYEDMVLKSKNPLGFELLYTKLLQSANNAFEVARLVSASTSVREVGEIVFGIYTCEGDAIALSQGLMIHVHTISRGIKWMIEQDYESTVGIHPGDIFFNNDPYIGGAHAPDQLIMTPIFHGEELVGWAGGMTHVPEVGSVEPGGMGITSTNRFAEGLFLPCIKIGENDELKRDLEILVERNVRTPVWWLLDNRAKIAGCRMIRDDFLACIDEFGLEFVEKACHEYIEDTRLAARRRIAETLRPGRYREVGWRGITTGGRPMLLHAPLELTVTRDGRLIIECEGLSPAGPHPFQGTLPCFEGNLFNTLIQNCFYDLRYNTGVVLLVELHVPHGSACDPPTIFYPTALWGPAYAGAIALSQAVSRAYYAGGYREEVHAASGIVCGYNCEGIDQYGRNFGGWNMELAAEGGFALSVRDGLDVSHSEFNPEGDAGDAEVWERELPPLYLGRSIRHDAGGYGKYRGGGGLYSLYTIVNTPEFSMGSWGAAPIHPASGLMGGYPASCMYIQVLRNSNLRELIEQQKPLPHREGPDPGNPEMVQLVSGDYELARGGNYVATPIGEYDLYAQMSGDAGGHGDPIRRDPKAVLEDLENGLTTARTARNVYCVALVQEGNVYRVDFDETELLRETRRKQRLSRGVPARQFIEGQRLRILSKDLPEPMRNMYSQVFAFSPAFARDYCDFWSLPPDFTFEKS